MSCSRAFSLLILSFGYFIQLSHAQQSETGLPAFGSFHGGTFDNVNLQNGNLHLEIPIVSVPQRVGPNYSYKFVYDIRGWEINKYHPTTNTTEWDVVPAAHDFADWHLLTDPVSGAAVIYDTVPKSCQYVDTTGNRQINNYNVLTNYVVVDTHGTRHPFELRHVQQPSVGCFDTTGNQQTGAALDGSGITLNIGTNGISRIVTWPLDDGTANGNIRDSLGRTTLASAAQYDTNNNKISETWTVQDSNGGSQQFRVDYALLTIQTHFCAVAPLASPCVEGGTTSDLPQKLTLPDNRFYQFTYSTDGNADLVRIDLPTGGYLAYGYISYSRIPFGQHGISQIIARRRVASRTVNDGTTANTWTYSGTNTGGSVVDPLGNEEVHVFGWGDSGSLYESQVRTYQGTAAAGTLLRTVNKDYTGEVSTPQPDAMDHGTINVRLTRTTTILEDGTQNKVETDYETFQQSFVDSTNLYTVTRLNPVEKREYDFGAGAPGALKRRTTDTYLHTGNQNYLALNITRNVLVTTAFDGSGTQVAKTTNEYDNYSHAGLPMQPSGAVQHNASYSISYIYRGNVTAVGRWRNTDNATLTTVNQYDDAGNVIATVDPLNHKTSFDSTDSWVDATCAPAGQGKAYVTSITDAAGHVTTKKYNSCTGSLASTTDPNLKTTSTTYDLMGRPSQVTLPDGGLSTWCYSDVQSGLCYDAATIQVKRTAKVSSTLNKIQTSVFGGLGRIKQTQLNSDPSGVTYVDTTYDANGRKRTVSNPYRTTGETTYGLTTFNYDPLDRTTSVVEPDGGTPTPGYAGSCTTATDEAGKSRKSCTDGLGRLAQVFEDPAVLNYQTLYQYDTLGNLICTEQHGSATTGTGCSSPPSSDATSPWRVRRFTYNSLSQLLTATNPESGTISYAYDDAGNLLTKTAPKPNQTGALTVATSYSYDNVNRLIQKSYNDSSTATVKYGYDGIAPSGCTPAPPAITSPTNLVGRRSAMCDASGATSWSYDPMGRAAIEKRTLNSVTNQMSYTYYPDGETASVTYPSGSVTNYQVTTAGRNVGASGPGTAFIPQNTAYAPQGAVSTIWLGSGSAGSIYSNFYYDKRLQPEVAYATRVVSGQANSLLYGFCYDYHLGVSGTFGDANVTCSVTASALGDNGNIYKINNKLDDNRTQNYSYDALNRIAQGYTNGSAPLTTSWGETFTIDAWGNLTNRAQVANKQNYEGLNAAPASFKNQLPGTAPDAAGNLWDNGTYTYDAENRITTTGSWTYVYDGDGERVKKVNGSSGTLYWGGASTDALAESNLTGTMSAEYLFYLGKRMARRDLPSGTVHYYLSDQLGSARVIADVTGALQEQSDYSPYGGEIWSSGSDPNHYKFTGKERDTETGNDYFGARYYSSASGHFMTPDWAPNAVTVPFAEFGDPQSLNLYGYVRNNPISRNDPDGHLCGSLVGGDGTVVSSGGLGCQEKSPNTQAVGGGEARGAKYAPTTRCE